MSSSEWILWEIFWCDFISILTREMFNNRESALKLKTKGKIPQWNFSSNFLIIKWMWSCVVVLTGFWLSVLVAVWYCAVWWSVYWKFLLDDEKILTNDFHSLEFIYEILGLIIDFSFNPITKRKWISQEGGRLRSREEWKLSSKIITLFCHFLSWVGKRMNFGFGENGEWKKLKVISWLSNWEKSDNPN